ncbi:MAG TPA: hypothetical protein VKB86_02900 [Pyrinomonadaceae bacterium]|nr:hypothetical protein [Pyrinomonadaceae bacterium]
MRALGGARGRVWRRKSAEGSRALEKLLLKMRSVGGRRCVASDIAAASRGRGLCVETDVTQAHSVEQAEVKTSDAMLAVSDDSSL